MIGSPTGRYLSISKHHKTPHKVWLNPSLLQTQTAGTKFPTARLLRVTTPLQFYSQLLRSVGSLMNVSVSTDALHSPVCVFYVDSSLPWPAESAVSGPSDPPCILCNSSTLSVASTDIPPPHFTKGYQCLVLSPSEPPPPIIFFFFLNSIFMSPPYLSVNKMSQRGEKEKCFISVQIRKDRDVCLPRYVLYWSAAMLNGGRKQSLPEAVILVT